MPTLIPQATRIAAAGNKPKCIDEFIGRVNSQHDQIERRAHDIAGRLGRAGTAA